MFIDVCEFICVFEWQWSGKMLYFININHFHYFSYTRNKTINKTKYIHLFVINKGVLTFTNLILCIGNIM